jgi:hypothetical protein
MQFIVIAYDGTDAKALERRMSVREEHLKQAKMFFDNGKWLYAVGILSDDGIINGSMVVCDFPSRIDLEEEWIKNEPYILGNVWDKIKIHRAQVAPFIK